MKIFMKSSFYLRLLPVSILLIFSALIFSAAGVMADVTKKTVPTADGKPAIAKKQPLKKSEQEKILGRIRHKYSQKESFSGRFTQKTTYTDSNETTLSMGKIWIQGPDKMRWEYQLPEKQMLISDGKTIWYYTPDLNQVMIGKVEDIKEARVLV
ncbi:MAG: outer membrane lipoprotein chaperone LolA, partial [Deltaproteobacteria bacterium]|nr:outer membrane lipoprotein chaperone LolA [Deltaproteobacteria bacterium]